MPTFHELWKAANTSGLPFVIAVVVVFLGTYAGYVGIKRWSKTPIEAPCTPTVEDDSDDDYAESHAEYERVFKDIIRHPFFPAMRYAVKYRIPHLDIPEPCRKLIFRDLLKFKFTTFLENLQAFIQKGDLNSMSVEHFHEAVLTVVSTSIMEYEQKMRESAIPEVVIDRFGRWHQNTIDLIMELIENASNSRFYRDNNARMVAILDWLQAAFQITLLDAEKTLGSLNGELDGITYKGVKAHCKHKNKCAVCDHPEAAPKGIFHNT